MLIELRKTMTEKTPARLRCKPKMEATIIGMDKKYIRIGICVDDPVYMERLIQDVSTIADRRMIKCKIDCIKGEDALVFYRRYDLILIDIASKAMSILRVKELLNLPIKETMVVFFSTEFQKASIGRNESGVLIGYIKMSGKGFEKILETYSTSIKEKTNVVLPTKRGIRKCCISDIVYAETWERGVKLTMTNGHEQVRFGISKLNALLAEEQFIMCHRAYLVNMAFVRYIRSRELELMNGDVIPVSKHRLRDVRKKFMRYSNDR